MNIHPKPTPNKTSRSCKYGPGLGFLSVTAAHPDIKLQPSNHALRLFFVICHRRVSCLPSCSLSVKSSRQFTSNNHSMNGTRSRRSSVVYLDIWPETPVLTYTEEAAISLAGYLLHRVKPMAHASFQYLYITIFMPGTFVSTGTNQT